MAHRTITLKGDPILKEAGAGEAGIYPGMLVEKAADGDYELQDVAGENCARDVALEDDLKGNEVGTVYTAANRMVVGSFRRGDEVAALVASGENIAIGDRLAAKGDGYWKETDTSTETDLAVALESSGGALAAATLIRVQIL